MPFSNVLKRALASACYGFCGLTLLYSLIMIGVYDTNANMSVFVVLLFYPLCFTISLANGVLLNSKLGGFARSLVRYVVCLASAGLFICLPHKAAINGTVALILFFFFTLLYVICSVVYALFFASRKKQSQDCTQYVSVYKNENKK